MADLNKTTYFYRKTFARKEAEFNRPMDFPGYLIPMVGDKKEIDLAELGAGPIVTIGNYLSGVKVNIVASDIFSEEYRKFWKQSGKVPLQNVEYQDMEKLSYPDESFDIVHCVNALDHTPDPFKAIEEMKRICKLGGWIYMRHAPGQKTRYKGIHHYNFEELDLPQFHTTEEAGLIVNIWRKI